MQQQQRREENKKKRGRCEQDAAPQGHAPPSLPVVVSGAGDDPEPTIEEFELDDIEEIESKVFA
jgi:hypothetical protein